MVDLNGKDLKDNGTLTLCEMLNSADYPYQVHGLHLYNNNISHLGLKSILKVVLERSELETLGLSENPLGSIGALKIARAIESNDNSFDLELRSSLESKSDSSTQTDQASSEVRGAIKKALHQHTIDSRGKLRPGQPKGERSCFNIRNLGLDQCEIKDNGAIALCRALRTPGTKIETLGLFENTLGVRGANTLAASLRVTKSITTLDVRYCGLTRRGCKEIIESQITNPAITRLYMSDNLGDKG